MDSEGDETKAVRVEGGVSGPRPITFRCLRHSSCEPSRTVCAERFQRQRAQVGSIQRNSPTNDRPTLQRPESRVPKPEISTNLPGVGLFCA